MAQSQKELEKNYKKWVIKATKAAIEAKKKGEPKETYLPYIAADNIAKIVFSKLAM